MSRVIYVFLGMVLYLLALTSSISAALITQMQPAKHAVDVTRTASVSATFDEAMDPESFNDTTFILNGDLTGFFAGTIAYDEPSRTATFTPSRSFHQREVITVTITRGVRTSGDVPLDRHYSWQFYTESESGNGNFTIGGNFRCGYNMILTKAADFNGDGCIDLATIDWAVDSFSVLLNNCDGQATFAHHLQYYAQGDAPTSFTTGDWDNDGDIDIAVVLFNQKYFTLFRNDGTGHFTYYDGYSLPIKSFTAIGSADFNGDGLLDLAVTNNYYSKFYIFTNTGNLIFAVDSVLHQYVIGNTNDIVASDLNNDGYLDVAISYYGINPTLGLGHAFTYMGTGTGSFTYGNGYASGNNSYSIHAGDMNRDGWVDLVLPNPGRTTYPDSTFSVFYNQGGGDYNGGRIQYRSGPAACDLTLADLDADGDLDVGIENTGPGYNFAVFRNLGDGAFSPACSYPTNNVYLAESADFDNDGDVDLVTSYGSRGVQVLLNGATATTTSWSFGNSEANMWPESWWQQFNYCYPNSPCNVYCLLCKSRDFPDWNLFAEAIGVEQAYFDPPPGTVNYRPSALAQWQAIRGDWTGSCFGFAATASLFHDSLLTVIDEFPGVSDLHSVTLGNESRVLINRFYLYQFGFSQQDLITHASTSVTPAQTLTNCQTMISTPQRCDQVLMMFNQNTVGGHAVMPYRFLQNPTNLSLWYIYVHDSNFPEDTTRRVEINTASNTWSYSGQPGWGGSYGLFLLDSVSNYLNPLVLADTSTATEQIRFYFGEADSAHFTSGTTMVGFDQNGTYGSVTGGSPIIPVDGNETPPIGYFLPTGEWYCRASGVVDGVFTVVDGHKRVFRNGGAKSGIISCYYRADAIAPSLTSYGGGVKSGRGIYDSSFIEVISITPDSEVVVQISGLEIPAGDSVTLTLTADQQVQVDNFGAAAEYDLLIQIVSPTVDAKFYHEALAISASTSHLITPDWRIQNDSVVIAVDTSMTGSFKDSTITISNSGLIAFVCGDADASEIITISDVVFLINYIFGGGPAPNPVFRGDADCNGIVTISDAVYLINYIFGGGAVPCAACQ